MVMMKRASKGSSIKPINLVITIVATLLVAAAVVIMGKNLIFDALAQAGEFLTPDHLWSLITQS